MLKSEKIGAFYKEYFKRCVNGNENEQLSLALSKLIDMLRIYYNEQVIVLLDEYDAPILESYNRGYYKECITFMKEVFSSTFKDNNNLKKGIITGVLRVSKEGIFSDANNIDIYNITDYKCFIEFGNDR